MNLSSSLAEITQGTFLSGNKMQKVIFAGDVYLRQTIVQDRIVQGLVGVTAAVSCPVTFPSQTLINYFALEVFCDNWHN